MKHKKNPLEMLGIRHEIILNIKTKKKQKKTGISMEYGNKH